MEEYMKNIFRIIALLLIVAMLPLSLIACNLEVDEDNTEDTQKSEDPTDKKQPDKDKENGKTPDDDDEITADGTRKVDLSYNFRKVKTLGRTSLSDAGIICDHSASGIEFTGTMKGDVYVDVVTSGVKGGCTTTYFTVYIDGERQPKRLSVEPGRGELYVARFAEEGEHTIRVVKQTESNYTLCLMQYIRLDGKLSTPPKQNDLYIEFIGDSLTCGMGNIGDNSSPNPQTPKWEDATQSYAYMLAEELGADYSIISESGIGISGSWFDPIDKYYTKASYSRDKDTDFEFDRVPDMIVINLGTNDYFLNKDKDPNMCKPEEVEAKTEELIKLVRECSGKDVPIVWAYGFVGDFLLDRINAAIDTLGGEDSDIYTCRLPKNTGGAQGHPTVDGHKAAAEALKPMLYTMLMNKTLDLSEDYEMVKTLGRCALSDNGIICDFSASGIEFCGEMVGDVYVDLVTKVIKAGCEQTYFTVYVDGVRSSTRLSVGAGSNSIKVASFDTLGKHTVKLVKQTESNYTICEIEAINFTGKLFDPPAQKELYIEFIGDSLTCGMGNIGVNSSPNPQPSPWEDATQSYGYMVAEQLDADYSIVSQSGIGIAGGWSNYPMATYFTAQSYTRDKEKMQEFTRVPDLIVINLGTNDHFINHDKSPDECKPEDVERMTEELILLVRKCYGENVPIIWAQGMVGTFLLDRIQAAIDKLGGEDAGIYTYFSLPRNTGGAQWHPDVSGHVAAANAILPVIKSVLGIQ